MPSSISAATRGSTWRSCPRGDRVFQQLLDEARELGAPALPFAAVKIVRAVLVAVDQREEEATVPEMIEQRVDQARQLANRLADTRHCFAQRLMQTIDAVEHHA